MLEYRASARRIDSHGSEATTKNALIVLDTDVAGRLDAFNPAELLLASLAACIIKGIERVKSILKFSLRGVEARLHGLRQDKPPKMIETSYEIVIDTDESDRRFELPHANARKFDSISNTLAGATRLYGVIRRKSCATIMPLTLRRILVPRSHGPLG